MRVQSEIMKKWPKKKVIEKLEWTDAEVQPVAVWPTKDGYTRQNEPAMYAIEQIFWDKTYTFTPSFRIVPRCCWVCRRRFRSFVGRRHFQ